MGTGLIWAGLGKGIADLGKTYGDTMIKSSMNDLDEERAARRAEMLDELKANREAKRQAETSKRLQDETDVIQDRAKQAALTRDASSMTAGAATVPQEGEFAGQAVKPEDIANLPPAARAIYEKSGMLTQRTESQSLKDQSNAAREIGADPTLRKELADATKVAEKSEADDARRQFDYYRADLKDASEAEQRKLSEKRMNAVITAASGKGDTGVKSVAAFLEGTRKSLNDENDNLQKKIETEIGAVKTPARIKAVMDKYQPQLDALAEKNKQFDSDFNYAREKVGLPSASKSPKKDDKSPNPVGKSPINELPKGAVQIGTSKGKPVYKLPDGSKVIAN